MEEGDGDRKPACTYFGKKDRESYHDGPSQACYSLIDALQSWYGVTVYGCELAYPYGDLNLERSC